MKDIAKVLQVSLPAATGIVNRLVTLGMLKRVYDSGDRRVIFIEVTASGKKCLEKVKVARKMIIEKMFRGLSEQERQTYLRILRKVNRNLHDKNNASSL
jgi:DNA-binding MarR family transcriptional regulator